MTKFVRKKELIQELFTQRGPGNRLITIDGWLDSGKTTLAYCIGCFFRIPVISLDQFASRSVPYVDAIDYDLVGSLIDFYTKERQKSVVVEGVCLLEVLERLDLAQEIQVYVSKISEAGVRFDGRQLDSLDANSQKVVNMGKLEREVFDYHRLFSPHSRAKHVYEVRHK